MQTILNRGDMLLHIDNILSPEDCQAVLAATADSTLWKDGKATAKGSARAVKENRQGDAAAPAVKGALTKIQAALSAHTVFAAAAHPAAFIRMTINQYAEGMAYGDHVDAPYIDGRRTDLSFTLFLSSPDDYEGGALVIDNAGHEDVIRGPAGSVVLYPATSVHRVETVTRGMRVACIGWVQSRVKSADHRSILFELETALADLKETGAPQPVRNRLVNLRNNLLRLFGE